VCVGVGLLPNAHVHMCDSGAKFVFLHNSWGSTYKPGTQKMERIKTIFGAKRIFVIMDLYRYPTQLILRASINTDSA
jgi:hypothetical protein